MTKSAYVVIPAHPKALEAARAGGVEILYEGDIAGVADFFGDLTRGAPYAVLAATPPDSKEQVRAALLKSQGLTAQLVASLLSVRSLFPVDFDQENLLGTRDQDFDVDVTTTLEQWLYDHLPKLQRELHQVIYPKGREEEA